MKKILSLMMVLSILLSAFSVISFAEEKITVDENVYGLLSAIGIADEADVENADKPITRGEFVKYLTGAYGLNPYLPEDISTSYFYDVDVNHTYAKEINMAYNAKLINGYGDGSFRPYELLSANDMITFVVSMLGYSYQANAYGGYPTGYAYVGTQIGLYKGVNISGSSVTKADALKLIYNALNANIMTQSSISPDSDNVKLEEGNTLLYSKFKVGKVEGVLEANDLTWLKTGKDMGPFLVHIDGAEYEVGHSGAEKYLGYSVEAYYRYDDYIDENTILYITPMKNKNKEITLDIKDIESIGAGNLTYYNEKEEQETLKYDTGASVIYNGSATSYPFNKNIIPEGYNGTIKLLSNNNGAYNVIFVDAYKDYFVTEVNYKEYIIYENKDKITLNPELEVPFCDIYNEQGEPADFSEIQRYSVVSVYESKDDAKQKYLKVFISNNTLRGTVEGIYSEDGAKHITINREVYSFEDEYVTKRLNTLILGRSYEFSLNHKGNICGARALSDDSSLWGYIITGTVVDDPVESIGKVKMFSQLGVVEEFEFAKNITVDGVPYKEQPDKVLEWLEKSSFATFGVEDCYAQMVKFEQNDMGKITKIDTILMNTGAESLRKDTDTDNMIYNIDLDSTYYTYNQRTFSGKALISSEADVFTFTFPTKDSKDYLDEDNYNIVSISSINTRTYTAKAYYEGNTSIQASALIINSDGDKGETSYDRFSIVDKITKTVDSDGNPCYCIYAYKDGSAIKLVAPMELTYKDESDLDSDENPKVKSVGELDAGDIFMYAANEKTDMVNSVTLYYYSDIKKMTSVNSVNSSFTATRRFVEGTVFEKYDDGFALTLTTDIANIGNAELEYYIQPSCPIMVYDSKTGRVSNGSFNEMEAYQLAGSKASRILMHVNQVVVRTIFIIK